MKLEEDVVKSDENNQPDELICPVLGKFSIEQLKQEPKKVKYYTSFNDYEHFMFFYYSLGPAVDHLSYKSSLLSSKDELFLTLIKLRQGKEDRELSFYFSVSETTVSKIIVTWITFLYFQLREINIWPSREIVSEHMPLDFRRKFPLTRVILDATEIPIQKPSHVDSQCATWSSYKHRNTLKTMVGCTPRGTVSFISDSYGGSVSDRQIIERSDLIKPELRHFKKKDSIMADRGIMIQDLFATRDVFVNIPTMLKGKSQLEPEEVVHDRRVASKRIHIERVIGLAKTFKILRNSLPSSKVILGSRINYVCFSIVNFRPCIVNQNS
ncbi:uncharacterized protein LOC134260373 [Saccostrea cucullata]|uniref:uncharacterized protein LOC134260373 n=1 Tax=Saccostrea cuccullata TaxID=36930 RepID=UPI002ED08502